MSCPEDILLCNPCQDGAPPTLQTENHWIAADCCNPAGAASSDSGSGDLSLYVLTSTYNDGINSLAASVSIEALARTTADTALASLITTVTATANANSAAITTEQIARAGADGALATSLTVVQATTNTKNRTFIQSTTPTGSLTIGDLWIDTTGALNVLKRWNGSAWVTTNVESGAIAAAVSTETSARTTADTAIASTVTTLTAVVGTNTAAITAESTARATADSALAASIAALVVASGTGARVFVEAPTPTALNTNDLWYDTTNGFRLKYWNGTTWVDNTDTRLTANIAAVVTETTARVTADTAQATQITSLLATTGSHTSSISTISSTYATQTYAEAKKTEAIAASNAYGDAIVSTEQAARVSADGALSTSISTVSATVGSLSSAVTSEASARATADGYLAGDYKLTVAAGNVITGMRLTSNTSTPAGVSEIAFTAAVFKIYDGVSSNVVPFSVSGGVVSMNNVAVKSSLDVGTSINRTQIDATNGIQVGGQLTIKGQGSVVNLLAGTGTNTISLNGFNGTATINALLNGVSKASLNNSGDAVFTTLTVSGTSALGATTHSSTATFSSAGTLTNDSNSRFAITALSSKSIAINVSGSDSWFFSNDGSLKANGSNRIAKASSDGWTVPLFDGSNNISFKWSGSQLRVLVGSTDIGSVQLGA